MTQYLIGNRTEINSFSNIHASSFFLILQNARTKEVEAAVSLAFFASVVCQNTHLEM